MAARFTWFATSVSGGILPGPRRCTSTTRPSASIVRNNETKETAAADTPFQIVPRVKGSTPGGHGDLASADRAVQRSSLPGGKPVPRRLSIAQWRGNSSIRTPAQTCRGSISNNVLVAGMRADTEYKSAPGGDHRLERRTHGDWLPFHTGVLDGDFAPVSIAVPRASGSVASAPVAIFSSASASAGRRPFATDLQGRVIWYLRSGDFMTRVLPGGRFLVLADGQNTVNSILRNQAVARTGPGREHHPRNQRRPRRGTTGIPRHPLRLQKGREGVRLRFPSRGDRLAERPLSSCRRTGADDARRNPGRRRSRWIFSGT